MCANLGTAPGQGLFPGIISQLLLCCLRFIFSAGPRREQQLSLWMDTLHFQPFSPYFCLHTSAPHAQPLPFPARALKQAAWGSLSRQHCCAHSLHLLQSKRFAGAGSISVERQQNSIQGSVCVP